MPSLREEVAQNLLDTCVCGGLDQVYGANKSRATDAKGKAYWSVSFCRARILDGEIKVYAENFIVISWQTAIRDLPSTGKQRFHSETAAKEFLMRFIPR